MSGTVITVGGSLFNNSVTDAKLRDSIALSIIGRPVNTDGDPSDIQATVDGDVLRLSGTTLGFGSIPESSVTGLVADLSAIATSLAGKSDIGHTHVESDITGLVADLSARPTGSGSANTIPKWTGASALGNSSLTDDGTTFAVNTNKFTVVEASGNTSVAGTLGVSGDFAVATNKFTVAAASGNTLVAGTLSSTGDFAVATNKFTVAASSGNTLVAGTLTVSTMTAASVPFIGTAGLLSQDNTNFTWDNTNKQLIVISPSQVALWVKSNNQPSSVVYVQNTNATGAADLNFVDNTTANRIGIGYANASYGEASRISKGYIWRNGVNFSFVRPTNILDATIFTNGNWNIGSTATDPGVKLRVEGTGTITGNTIIGTNGSNRHTSNGGLDCINAIGTTMASLDSLSASPLAVWDSTAQATGVGGGILFLGKYLNSGGYAGAGGIKLFKENGTDNNYSFGLGFGTRANGGNLTQWLRLTSAGEAVFGDTLSAPTKSGFSTSFEVARTSASARFLLSSYGTSIQSTMYLYRGRGTAASTTVIQSTDGIGSLAFTGATGSGSSDFFEGARIAATATENWSLSSNFGTKLEFTTTTNAAGSGGRAVRLTIDHDGTATFANAVTQNAGNVLLNQTSGSTGIGGASVSLGRLVVYAAAGDVAGIFARNVLTAQTLSGAAVLQGAQTGTYDTTLAGRTSIAVQGSSTSTRSAGANDLTNTGGLFSASGAQVNRALVADAGDVILNNTSGSTTINGDTTIGSGITKNHTINGKIVQSVQANAHGIDITQSQTGQTTTSKAGVNILVSGSYNTTAGNLTAYAIKAAITATESAGSNTLQNICASFTASGADQNIALATLSGDVVLNSASGTTTINGATTIAAQLDMNSHKIVNVTDPASAQDAATKAYVDAAAAAGGIGRQIGFQIISSSGTYTPTSGTKRVRIRMIGGGGGGGGAAGGSGARTAAGGGASGMYMEFWIDPSASITGGAVSIGAGGSAGSSAGGNGGNGGDTTIVIQGTTYTSKGGTGGTGVTADGWTIAQRPVSGSTSVDIMTWGPGGQGFSYGGGSIIVAGSGGSTPLGAGGATASDAAGQAGGLYGGGGSGANHAGTTDRAGGAGGAGGIIVEEFN